MKKGFLMALMALCFFSILVPADTVYASWDPLGIGEKIESLETIVNAISNPWETISAGIREIYSELLMGWAKLITWVVGGAALSFDYTLHMMTQIPEGLNGAIIAAWKIIRDIANIFIVFSLLYLGIKTIIQGDGFADKKVFAAILFAAIIINFSLFFTKNIAFDVSNTVAVSIMEGAGLNEGISANSRGADSVSFYDFFRTYDSSSSISAGFMKLVSPQQFLETQNQAQDGKTSFQQLMSNTAQVMILTVVIVLLGVIFLGSCLMLIHRFVIFVMLMITSPFGIVASLIPWFKQYGKMWWDQLKKQFLFFPSFVLVLYLVLMIVGTINQNNRLILGDPASTYSFIFNFIIMMFFMFGILILPGKMGAAGSDIMSNTGKWMKSQVSTSKIIGRPLGMVAGGAAVTGRTVGGRLIGGGLADNKWIKKRAQKGGYFAQKAIKTGASLRDSTFDVRNIDAVKKSSLGKGMGTGIKNWKDAVKTKQEDIKKKKDKEMKMFGFDKLHETDEAKKRIVAAEDSRKIVEQEVKDARRAYEADRSDAKFDVLKAAEIKLKVAEGRVGAEKNIGEFMYSEQLRKKTRRSFGVKGKAHKELREELNKKWQREGQSSGKKKEIVEKKKVEKELNDDGKSSNPTPSPTPPTP